MYGYIKGYFRFVLGLIFSNQLTHQQWTKISRPIIYKPFPNNVDIFSSSPSIYNLPIRVAHVILVETH